MFRETKSDGQGHFIFNGVCAGEVKVDARYYTSSDFSRSEGKAMFQRRAVILTSSSGGQAFIPMFIQIVSGI